MMKGFTFLEIVLVVAIFLILGGVVGAFASGFVNRNALENNRDRIVGSLRKAQAYAIDNKDGEIWGVCLFGGKTIRMFSGSCNTPRIKNDFGIIGGVNISGLETNIIFSKNRGEIGSGRTITLVHGTNTAVILINAAGVVNVE